MNKPMNMLPRIGVFALVAALAGCSSMNPMNWFGSSSTAERPTPLVAFKPAVNLKTGWQAKIGAAHNYAFAPGLSADAIYVAGYDGQLAKLDAANGATLWRIATGGKLSAGVGIGADLELVGTPKGQLLAFDGNGKPRWQVQLSSEVLGVPQVAEGTVVARTADGHIYALDARDGKRKWMYERALPALSLRSQPGVLITRGGVFAGYAGGKLVALALDTGVVGWEASVAIPRGASEIERIADVTSSPVADDKQVCAAAYQGRVACFDLRTGNLDWARDLSSVAGLTMDDRNLYVTNDKGEVVALEKTRGVNLWTQDKLRARHTTAPRRVGNYLAVGDGQGYVHLLALDDGSFAGRSATDGSAIISRPQPRSGGVVVQTANGSVYALAL
ncbi:outer membrane protein assembly factor BamB [Sulfuriferula plumbiphila]|uniref:Outer membrane protein assembly factor BamB n=1 Tax=Sulfuriferula plumbiphila TaxID=171865 RepID=A0A512L5N3_9PROT|nr:outer membrane protein assembly factor BamB [Sulfuriferula plumbiphila]BBP03467.1 outer membrane protein assembly factor BamB [Sulfuriferula plumbiphila]GEP29762.1 outer membrane protein assembly factor BamB [Sulfuriferula plumbiphila]